MVQRFSKKILCVFVALLAACGSSDDGAIDVAFMDSEQNMVATGIRLTSAGQHVRAATRSGLVALNQHGEVVPSLAESWNVIEGGSIFVFRLREGSWPDGDVLSAESVRLALNRAIRELRGTSLGLDLAPIDEIRAMTGRVIEIRVSSALPDLLHLLSQPELALTRGAGETGSMILGHEEGVITLSLKPPLERGLPEDERWREFVRDVNLSALDPAAAITGFEDGDFEVILGGRLGSLPLADTGPLSRGTVRLDPAIGLFGLRVRRARGVLESPELREALAMAMDRPALAESLSIGGWVPTTRLVAPNLPGDAGLVTARWQDESIEQLRQIAAARVANWQSANGVSAESEDLTLALAIGDEPGHGLLLEELQAQFGAIGIAIVRAESAGDADLLLVDRVARYAAPAWFLNQFNCLLDGGLCSEDADLLVAQALDEGDPEIRAALLGEAESKLAEANVYIPFGSPLRWSLVRGNVDGFAANPWGFHPLPDMAVVPR